MRNQKKINFLSGIGIVLFITSFVSIGTAIPGQLRAGDGIEFTSTVSLQDTINIINCSIGEFLLKNDSSIWICTDNLTVGGGYITTPDGISLNINIGDRVVNNGGDFIVIAGNQTGFGTGGNITLQAGTGGGGVGNGVVLIKGGSGSSGLGHVTIEGGNAGTDSHGASVFITATNAGGNNQKIGGSVIITAGEGVGGINGGGGSVNIQAGAQAQINLNVTDDSNGGSDGSINLQSGAGSGGFPGSDITITTGDGTGNAAGGTLILKAGDAVGNSDGGSITIDGGDSSGSGSIGDIILQGSGGNIGIGTTTPTNKLDVIGNVNVSGALIVNDLSGSYSNGEAAVCVFNNGTLFVRDGGCN